MLNCIIVSLLVLLGAAAQLTQDTRTTHDARTTRASRGPVILIGRDAGRPDDAGAPGSGPTFFVRFAESDSADPIDPATLAVSVDGVDRTQRLRARHVARLGAVAMQGGEVRGRLALTGSPPPTGRRFRVVARVCTVRGACAVDSVTLGAGSLGRGPRPDSSGMRRLPMPSFSPGGAPVPVPAAVPPGGRLELSLASLAPGERRTSGPHAGLHGGPTLVEPASAVSPPVATVPDTTVGLMWRRMTNADPALWYVDPAAQVLAAPALGNPGARWEIAAAGDFNSDSYDDILWQDRWSSGERVIWFMRPNATVVGAFSLGVVDGAWGIAAAGDFNDDGHDDIVWQNDVTGERGFWFMDGAARVIDQGVSTVLGTEWDIAAAGDFNTSDSHDDLVLQHANGERVVWWMDGRQHVAGSMSLGVVGTEWQLVAAGDVDWDGNDDLWWQNIQTGQPRVWRMRDGIVLSATDLGNPGAEWRLVGAMTPVRLPAFAASAEATQRIDPALCVADCFETVASYSTSAHVSLDVPRALTLVYRSNQAAPRVTVMLDVTDSSAASQTLVLSVRRPDGTVATLAGGRTEVVFAGGPGTSRVAVQLAPSESEALATGQYDYTAVIRRTRSTGGVARVVTVPLRLVVVNERESPFGAGWSVAGLQRIHEQADGSLVVTEGGGPAAYYVAFGCPSECGYGPPPGEFSALTQRPPPWSDGVKWERRYPDGTLVRFDVSGRMTSVADRFGNANTYAYDWTGKLITIQDPALLAIRFYYEDGQRPEWKVGTLMNVDLPGGRVANFGVDHANDLRHLLDVDNVYAGLADYSGHRLMRWVDRGRGEWSYEYDFSGRLATRRMPAVLADGVVQRPAVRLRSAEAASLVDPASGQGTAASPAPRRVAAAVRATVTGPRGYVTSFQLHRSGAPTRIEDAVGGVAANEYDAATAQLTRSVSVSGHDVRYTWSGPRLTQVHDLSTGRTVNTTYETTYNQPTRIYGHTTEQCFEYDVTKPGHPLKVSRVGSCTAPATTYLFTGDGRLRSVTDPEGHTTTHDYLPSGTRNRSRETRPANRVTSFGYDGFGRTTSVTDPVGVTRTTDYDLLNRVRFTVGGESDTTRFEYDSLGNVKRVTDARHQVYEYRRNALGWVEARLDATPAHAREHFAYDLAGNVRTRTNRRGQTVRFTYDELDRVRTRVQDAEGGALTTYAYDPGGRWVTASNAESTDTIYFDVPGRVTEEVTRRPGLMDRAVKSSYEDPWGEREQVCLAGPAAPGAGRSCFAIVNFGYDAARRLSQITDSIGWGATIDFDGDELPREVTFLGGLKQTTTFSSIHRRSSTGYSVPAVNSPFSRRYEEDSLGLVTRKEHHGPRRREYAYDRSRRLHAYSDYERTTEVRCGVNDRGEFECETVTVDTVLVGESYSYDRVGNRTDNGASANDPANRLSSFGGYALTYDADGNLEWKDLPGIFRWRYVWNSLGQLVVVWRNNVDVAHFFYDGFGRRVRKMTRTAWDAPYVSTHYVWDGDQLAAELDGSGNPQATYAYYPGIDRLFSVTTGGQVYFAAIERPGNNVVGLIRRSDHAVVAQYGYRPFGAVEQDNPAIPNSLRWQGLQYDRETGLYYVRSRYYDPELARFVAEDPLGVEGGINLYVFAGNDPVNLRDPYGLDPCTEAQFEHGYQDFPNSSGGTDCIKPGGNTTGMEITAKGVGFVDAVIYRLLNRSELDRGFPEERNLLIGRMPSFMTGPGGAGQPALSAVKAALARVHAIVGRLPKGPAGKFGAPQRGTSIKGYRLDPPHPNAKPGSPETGWHINWWDWTLGKRGRGGSHGAIPIR